MSLGHSLDIDIRTCDTLADDVPAEELCEATNGDIHLLVTFDLGGVRRHDATNVGPNGPQGPGGEPDRPDVSLFDAEPSAGDAVKRDSHSSLCTAVGTSRFDEAADIESLVSYLELDFFEHELFAREFLPDEDEIRYTNRGIGDYQLLCVYDVDRGIVVVVDKSEPIKPIVDRARSTLTQS